MNHNSFVRVGEHPFSETTQPLLICDPVRGERRCSLNSQLFYGRSGASALPCAGAAPPQRPPTKPSLTDRVSSFQPCGSSSVSSQQCLLPHLPPQPTDQRPLISGVPLTTGVPLKTKNWLLKAAVPTVSAHSSRTAPATRLPPTEYAIRQPEWRQEERAGQGKHCIWLSSYLFSITTAGECLTSLVNIQPCSARRAKRLLTRRHRAMADHDPARLMQQPCSKPALARSRTVQGCVPSSPCRPSQSPSAPKCRTVRSPPSAPATVPAHGPRRRR